MAYIYKSKNTPDWNMCSVYSCTKEASYLKDEEFLICKEHAKSRLDLILEKRKNQWTKEDQKFIQKYVSELNTILKKLVKVFKKGKYG